MHRMRSNYNRMAVRRPNLGILCLIACVILRTGVISKALDGKGANNSTIKQTTSSGNTSTTVSTLNAATVKSTVKSENKTALKYSPTEARRKPVGAGRPVDDLDGRSAYVNNQYIPDEPLADTDNSPPLYQFLQEQMEQILASTGSEVADYVAESSAPTHKDAQYGFIKPVHSYMLDTLKDYDEDTETVPHAKEQDKILHSYTRKPSVAQELPRPIATVSTQNKIKPVRTIPQLSYGSPPAPISKPVEQTTTKYLTRNSTIHVRKRRIVFKTVSSASQIIATPLADLMFKFSIGIAKPSVSTASSPNSLLENVDGDDVEPGYTGNLDLPKRNRPVPYAQKSAAALRKP